MITLDALDITAQVIPQGAMSQALSAFVKIIAQERQFLVADNQGVLSPFSAGGALSDNRFRNVIANESNEAGRQLFRGQIDSVSQTIDDQLGYSVNIAAKEFLAILLEFVVEENAIFEPNGAGYSQWVVQGNKAYGTTTITINPSPAHSSVVPKPALVSFTTLSPRYQVVESAGSMTNVVIERPLEVQLGNGSPVRFTLPVAKTIPRAIKDALLTAGVPSSRLSQSFDTLAALDGANTIDMMVLKENNVSLAQHIGTLLELGGFNLTIDQDGVIGILRTLQYRGQTIRERITENELVKPLNIVSDNSRLYIGYDLLYLTNVNPGTGAGQNAGKYEIAIESFSVSPALVAKYRGKKRFQPIKTNGSYALAYNYLYSSQASAQYHGANILTYYATPRVRISGALKRAISGDPLNVYQVDVGREFLLSLKIGNGNYWYDEPSATSEYVFDDASQAWKITLELTNLLSPNLPRLIQIPVVPSFSVVAAINGFTVTFTTPQNELYIYLEDKSFLIDRVTVWGLTATVGNLNSGQIYYLAARGSASGLLSESTTFQKVVAL